MRNRAAGENLPEGYVRENFYLVYEAQFWWAYSA